MKIGDPRAAREWFLRARSTGADAALAVRLAAAERAIDTERPLEDEGTPAGADIGRPDIGQPDIRRPEIRHADIRQRNLRQRERNLRHGGIRPRIDAETWLGHYRFCLHFRPS